MSGRAAIRQHPLLFSTLEGPRRAKTTVAKSYARGSICLMDVEMCQYIGCTMAAQCWSLFTPILESFQVRLPYIRVLQNVKMKFKILIQTAEF